MTTPKSIRDIFKKINGRTYWFSCTKSRSKLLLLNIKRCKETDFIEKLGKPFVYVIVNFPHPQNGVVIIFRSLKRCSTYFSLKIQSAFSAPEKFLDVTLKSGDY